MKILSFGEDGGDGPYRAWRRGWKPLQVGRAWAKAAKCYRNRTVGDAMSERADTAEPRPDELGDIAAEQAESRHDEDDRLKGEFVSAVLDAVEADDRDRARELVSPLHPADIADLLELTPSERRGQVAAALGDLVGEI